MTTTSAFWRLFPASLFTILGLVWCQIWRADPVLIAIAVCIAAFASSWLIITVVEVARNLENAKTRQGRPARDAESIGMSH